MLSRNLDKAKKAFKQGDAEASKLAHQGGGHGKHAHERHQSGGQYIKSLIYGGLDGIITTFAVVAGVEGANLEASIVLILGFSNLIADGLSMAVGDYLSTKAENDYALSERKREAWEMEHFPEGEKMEMVEILEEKGMSNEDAQLIIETMAKYPDAFVDYMMVEELGIMHEEESPLRNAFVTFLSFGFFGFIPLSVFVLANWFTSIPVFPTAVVLTGLTLFAMGALKSRIMTVKWWRSGLEMLIVGGVAAIAAYGIGYWVSSWAL